MRSSAISFVFLAVVSLACSGPSEPAADSPAEVPAAATTPGQTTSPASGLASLEGVTLAYERIDSRVPFPVFMAAVPGTDLSVIATKEGRLWLYDGIDVHGEVYLDIRDRVRNAGEQGLLGVGFSPDYDSSRRLFVHYSDVRGDTVLAEFTAADLLADSTTEVIVFRIDQPAANHNGGMIEFGPDGFLYVGLGDGGRSNDAFGNGQNPSSVLGALLRFDVSAPGIAAPAPGNPFAAPEVWSIGLRNPWRFSIDPAFGLILIADVGQNAFEEISAALLSEPGVNYGWPITEGLHCFRPRSGCDVDGLTLPVLQVAHGDAGTCSITGGVVYRGAAIPALVGHYLFSDFCGGYLRSIPVEGAFEAAMDWTEQVGDAGRVVSFGTDSEGEVYVLNSDGGILKIVLAAG